MNHTQAEDANQVSRGDRTGPTPSIKFQINTLADMGIFFYSTRLITGTVAESTNGQAPAHRAFLSLDSIFFPVPTCSTNLFTTSTSFSTSRNQPDRKPCPAIEVRMASEQAVCMAGGDGETSYAKNSALQSGVQNMLKPLVEEAMADLLCRAVLPGCLRVADLGCSSGPNALALASAAVDAARRHGSSAGADRRCCPEICVYLNDLPDNDFNTVLKEVPSFLREHHREAHAPLVMVFGAPGSFYGRLFPAKTLHLVCSSFSLHWLSQVPRELVEGVLVNKGNVWAGRSSTPAVAAAYARQFEQDFKLFLASRAEEVVPGGYMVLSLCGRPSEDFRSQNGYSEFIAEILQDMACQGVIAGEEVDSFNEPSYSPCLEELRGAVELDGSFEVVRMESHHVVTSAPRGDAERSAAMARFMRVLDEWQLVRHFGVKGIGDDYARAAQARFMGPAAEEDMSMVIQIAFLRRIGENY